MLVRNSICSNANINLLYDFRCLLYDFRILSKFIYPHGIFQICMTSFVEHFILFYFILPWKSMGSNVTRTTTFFKISYLVFCRRKKVIQVWNDMRMVNNGGLKRTFREQKHLHLTLTVFWCKIPPHPVLCLIGKATVYKLMKEGLAFSTVNTFITRDR